MRHTGSIALALIALTARPASAQTRFQWPDTASRVATYTHIEDCVAATRRVYAAFLRRGELTEWRDTMQYDAHEGLEPLPPEVTQTAKRCAARFDVAKIEPREFNHTMELFLEAGRDSDAADLVEHRLASIPAKNAIERGAIVDSAVTMYSRSKPVRLNAADALLLTRAKTTNDRIERLKTYSTMLLASNNVEDSFHSTRAAKLIMGIADSLTAADRQSDEFERLRDGYGGSLLIYDALEYLVGKRTRMDSLRKSTVAYGALERGLWSKASGERPEALEIPIAQKAAPLTADVWYPASAASTPHPAHGRTSLVLFLEHTRCINEPSTDNAGPIPECAMRLAEVRRLAHRFPTLEITIVMATHGQFMYLPPTSPADETVLIKQLVDSAQIPGAILGVTTTPFWRLPNPDSRRIDKVVPNMEHYSFGKTWRVGSGSMFLVDSDGLIADAWRLGEKDLGEFIELLQQRQTKGN
jgi:hypothetical protein